MVNLKDKFFEALIPLYSEVASKQRPSGQFYTLSRKYTLYGQYAGIYFAWLYTLDRPDNPYFKDSNTLARAVSGWDFYATQISAEGKARVITYDRYWHDAVDEWGCYYWINTIALLDPYLPSETKARWNECIDRIAVAMEEVAQATLNEVGYLERLSSGSISNHFVWTLLCLYRHASVRGDGPSCDRNRVRFEQVLEHQLPSGTWTESGTLVIGYGEVTICAVSLFGIFDDNARAAEAVRRNLDYRLQTLYPNFRGNDCLEGRVHYSPGIFPYTAATFGNSREGKTYLARWIDYLQLEQPEERRLSEALQGLAVVSDLATHLPNVDILMDDRLPAGSSETLWPDLKARITRRDQWTVTMCCLLPSMDRSRWIMERQNLISVFHEKGGLVIGGGHSIAQPEFSTFNVISDGTMQYLHRQGELTDRGMTLRYGKCNCLVSCQVNDGVVHLRYEVEDLLELDRVLINLPVWVENRQLGIGEDSLNCNDNAFCVEIPSGDSLKIGSIRLTSTRHACLRYPIQAFDPYHQNQAEATEVQKQAILTLELTSQNRVCDITIFVQAS